MNRLLHISSRELNDSDDVSINLKASHSSALELQENNNNKNP